MPGALVSYMRLVVLGILLSSASALAAPTPTVPARPAPTKVVVEDLPQACRDLGTLANSASLAQALSARISLASCLIDARVRELALCDCEQSVNDLEAAAAPSIALLDEAFALGDPATKILARQALGDMLQSFATRLVATIPVPVDGSESAHALRETRLHLLMPLVSPWFVRSQAAYMELDRIARENPRLAKNPAVLTAVRASREKLAQGQGGVARR